MKTFRAVLSPLIAVITIAALGSAPAQVQTQKKKPPQKNQTKGTDQAAGGYVKFGEVYTLANGLNFQILKAKYTMEPFLCYNGKTSTATEKLLVVDFAVKNWTKDDKDLGSGSDLFYLIDSTGAKYYGEAQIKSHKRQEHYQILKPGQGIGQPALNDPLQIAFNVPLDAEVTKIMVNQPRLGKKEELLRFLIAGTDKEADASNVIAPLPPEVRDPSSKSGAVANKIGAGRIGASLPSGYYTYVVKKIESVTTPLSDKFTPEDGKRYIVVTMTIRNDAGKAVDYYGSIPRSSYVKDEDGEKSVVLNVLKASQPEEANFGELDAGDTVTVRVVIQVGASAKVKELVIAGDFYPWRIEPTGL